MDLDVMYDDVRVDEKILGFVEEEGEEEVFSKFRNFGRKWRNSIAFFLERRKTPNRVRPLGIQRKRKSGAF